MNEHQQNQRLINLSKAIPEILQELYYQSTPSVPKEFWDHMSDKVLKPTDHQLDEKIQFKIFHEIMDKYNISQATRREYMFDLLCNSNPRFK